MSHSQFRMILRHAWLSLWDKHMTTGRINQVTILNSPSPKQRQANLVLANKLPKKFTPKSAPHLVSLSYRCLRARLELCYHYLQSTYVGLGKYKWDVSLVVSKPRTQRHRLSSSIAKALVEGGSARSWKTCNFGSSTIIFSSRLGTHYTWV